MREYWVQVHSSPIVYRYVDWSITVPLQMIEFNLILKAAGKDTSSGMFWKLLLGTVMMLCFGYLGEIQVVNPWLGFIGGMCGWQGHKCRHVLEALARHRHDALFWIPRRNPGGESMAWLHWWHVWLVLHSV